MDKKIGERIRRIRAMKGLSQENVAEEVGISAGNFGKIERGENDPNTTRLIQIARALGVNVTDFFSDRQEVAEPREVFGFASKEDVITLTAMMQTLSREIAEIRENLPVNKPGRSYKKAGAKKSRKS